MKAMSTLATLNSMGTNAKGNQSMLVKHLALLGYTENKGRHFVNYLIPIVTNMLSTIDR